MGGGGQDGEGDGSEGAAIVGRNCSTGGGDSGGDSGGSGGGGGINSVMHTRLTSVLKRHLGRESCLLFAQGQGAGADGDELEDEPCAAVSAPPHHESKRGHAWLHRPAAEGQGWRAL